MKRFINLSVLMLSLFLMQCATTVKNLQPGVPVVEKEKYSYFYGSCQRPFLGLQYELSAPDLNLFVMNVDENNKTKNIKLSYAAQKRGEKGLFVFKVKPGKYTLYKIALENYVKTTDANFEVLEDTVYYLGYINFEKNLLNILANSVSVNIKNDEEMDKKILLDKYNFLEKSNFENLQVKK